MVQVEVVGQLARGPSGESRMAVTKAGGDAGVRAAGPMAEDVARRQLTHPCESSDGSGTWLYRDCVIRVTGAPADQEELFLRIEHAVLRHRQELDELRRELQRETTTEAGQETIPEDVRLFVWQRDGKKCVECGSRSRLVFQRFIPVHEGGSSAASNVQLLCQRCVLGEDSGRRLARSLIISVLVIVAAILLIPVFIKVLVLLAWVLGLLSVFAGVWS
jgi:5-methylcytosine-specific restriction endonuclease McrA